MRECVIINSNNKPIDVTKDGAIEVMLLRDRIAELEAENKRLEVLLDRISGSKSGLALIDQCEANIAAEREACAAILVEERESYAAIITDPYIDCATIALSEAIVRIRKRGE